MKYLLYLFLLVIILFNLTGCSLGKRRIIYLSPQATPTATPKATTSPTPTPQPTDTPTAVTRSKPQDLFALISIEAMFQTIIDLTNIEAYSGWRNSGSQGEREAIFYLKERLDRLNHLKNLGAEAKIQDFNVFLSAELWESRLHLTLNGQEIEVPADGLRGPRDNITQALRFDSDGVLNDAAPNPIEVIGPVVVIRTSEQINALDTAAMQDKIIFLDYAVIDRVLLDIPDAIRVASALVSKNPAGLVLVTSFSNKPNQSHGTFVGDVSVLNWVSGEANPPTLYLRLEDLQEAGIETWDDLAKIETARLTLDTDLFSPGHSQNLIVHIPGQDSSQAVILTAHIDSANNPGALDDAAGSAALLEIARVFNNARYQPETDIYLVWFGSQALGFYGAYNFVAYHQNLLDQTLAMLQIDSLSHPLDGINASLNLVTWSYGRLGNDMLTWPNYLAEAVRPLGLPVQPANLYESEADNIAFAAFNVPNAHLIYLNRAEMDAAGGFHFAGHSHDPYDTIDLVQPQMAILKQIAEIALTALISTAERKPYLRVTPLPTRRALFVGTHTEVIHMTPAVFTDLGMTLAMAGFDVDHIPFGQPLTANDLADTDLVIVLPAIDYAAPSGYSDQYDLSWSEAEIEALESYVNQGGFLILTNSAHRLKYGNWVQDPNEDWPDLNPLAGRFGITYYGRALMGNEAQVQPGTPLTKNLSTLVMAQNNGVAFIINNGYPFEGDILATVDDAPAAVLLPHGPAGGKVLALADIGMLNTGWNKPPANLPFWQNLADQVIAAQQKQAKRSP